jgi:hypothetical protein
MYQLNETKEKIMPNTMEYPGSNMPTVSLLATPYAWLSRLLAPCHDYWTWVTRNGSIYEEVEDMEIEDGMVNFRHRYGTGSVEISELAPEVQRFLLKGNDEESDSRRSRPSSFLVHTLSQAG